MPTESSLRPVSRSKPRPHSARHAPPCVSIEDPDAAAPQSDQRAPRPSSAQAPPSPTAKVLHKPVPERATEYELRCMLQEARWALAATRDELLKARGSLASLQVLRNDDGSVLGATSLRLLPQCAVPEVGKAKGPLHSPQAGQQFWMAAHDQAHHVRDLEARLRHSEHELKTARKQGEAAKQEVDVAKQRLKYLQEENEHMRREMNELAMHVMRVHHDVHCTDAYIGITTKHSRALVGHTQKVLSHWKVPHEGVPPTSSRGTPAPRAESQPQPERRELRQKEVALQTSPPAADIAQLITKHYHDRHQLRQLLSTVADSREAYSGRHHHHHGGNSPTADRDVGATPSSPSVPRTPSVSSPFRYSNNVISKPCQTDNLYKADLGVQTQDRKAQDLWDLVTSLANRLGSFGPGLAPIHRVVALRLEDLCDGSRLDFDLEGGAVGIHEFVSAQARKAELDLQVKEVIAISQADATKIDGKDARGSEKEMSMLYEKAFEEAGGQEAAEEHFAEINRVLRDFKKTRTPGRIRQDIGYEIMDLDAFYHINRWACAKLEQEVERICGATGGTPHIVPLKDRARARAKVLTKYGSDTSCLTDVMRASIVYPSIAALYRGLGTILREDFRLRRRDFRVVEVEDRFQNPKGGYRDVSILFDVDGVIGEVQLHTVQIVNAKKGGGHKAYRLKRLVNELLFEACVRNSEKDVIAITKEFHVCADEVRDKNGRQALHYSCQRGSSVGVAMLLRFSANPWSEDHQGTLPCELAYKSGHCAIGDLVLESMIEDSRQHRRGLLRLAQTLVPWWCDFMLSHPSGGEAEEARLRQWRRSGALLLRVLAHFQAQEPLEEWLLNSAANNRKGRVQVLLDAGFDVAMRPGQESIMDIAISQGLVDMTKMLRDYQAKGHKCCNCWVDSVHVHLRDAALKEDTSFALSALEAGADANHVTSKASGKRTPLMAFAAAGDVETCLQIIESRGHVQSFDSYGCSALHYAQACGHQSLLEEYMPGLKALQSRRHKDWRSPTDVQSIAMYLCRAASDGCCGAVARIQCYLDEEEEAVTNDVFRQVLSFGMPPFQITALHVAVQAASTGMDPAGQVCRALLFAKADPLLKSIKDETPLDMAAAAGLAGLYSQLEEAARQLWLDPNREEYLETRRLEEILHQSRVTLQRNTDREKKPDPRMFSSENNIAEERQLLLTIGLVAFRRAVLSNRLDTWREDTATTLLETLRKRKLSCQDLVWTVQMAQLPLQLQPADSQLPLPLEPSSSKDFDDSDGEDVKLERETSFGREGYGSKEPSTDDKEGSSRRSGVSRVRGRGGRTPRAPSERPSERHAERSLDPSSSRELGSQRRRNLQTGSKGSTGAAASATPPSSLSTLPEATDARGKES